MPASTAVWKLQQSRSSAGYAGTVALPQQPSDSRAALPEAYRRPSALYPRIDPAAVPA
ncbi:hypothetical protein D3C71_1731590 [compost metagenome]